MADFSQQDIQGPQGGVAPQQAVAPVNATAITASSIGQGLSALLGSGLGQTLAANKKAAAELDKDKLLAGYAKKVTGLNAAYEQGAITMADARRQQRAAYNTIISNFPQVADDVTKFHNTLQGAQGLGDVLANGTAVDQQLQTDTKAATASGFIQPNMTQAQQEAGLNSYRQQQHAINQMDFAGKQMEIQQKRLAIVSAQESIAAARVTRANQAYELNQKRNIKAVQNGLSDVAVSYMPVIDNKQADIQKRLDAGQITPEQAIQENRDIANQISALTQQVRGAAGGEWVDNLQKPLMDRIKAKEDFYSGKISADVAQHQLDNAQTRAILPIMSDPKAAAILSLSKMVPGLSDTLMSNFGQFAVDAIKKNMKETGTKHDPYPDGSDEDQLKENKVYMDSLRDITTKLGDKNPVISSPKETMDELSVNINNLIKGMNNHAASVENPKQMNQATDFLASKEFLQYQQIGGKIDASALAGVQNIVETNYLSTLVPAIQKQWEQSQVTTGYSFKTRQVGAIQMPVTDDVKTNKALSYRWTGSGIVFQAGKGFEKNSAVLAQARTLNRNLAGLINKTVRLRAHMEGSEDYTKYWKESEGEMFGVNEEAPNGE